MSSPSPLPERSSLRSESAASTRDSANLLAELAGQAILLLQKADPHTVVTALLKEKSYLHTQNGQLWRLVDKQRAALLDLQRDYQKVLEDKNRYQARLKALKQNPTRSFDQASVSTESSAQAVADGDGDGKQPPSRRSSARSVRSQRPPRSPQPISQLDALQASLEAEIAKSSDEGDSSASVSGQSTEVIKVVMPSLMIDSSGEPPVSRPRRVPTPLDLSPSKVRASEPLPRSAFLLPGNRTPEINNGRLSPYRDPPPSAPPFQTSTPASTTARPAPPLFSPGLPTSPRPYTPSFQALSPKGSKIIYDETESRMAQNGSPSTPRTSKPPTDTEMMTDSSSSPRTPGPQSPKETLVESIRKSPFSPRRPRIPSHRSSPSGTHTSTSSILTINEPLNSTSPVGARVSRSLSVDLKQPNGKGLVPPQESIERRKSRSFEDLHSLSTTFNEIQAADDDKTHSRNASLTGIGLDEAISEMQRANEESKMAAIQENQSTDIDATTIEQPKRPQSPVPSSLKSPNSLQPAFTARTRSSSNASRSITLAVSPSDVLSIMLSVLSIRSSQVPTATAPTEETLFTIRCRMRNVDKSAEREILRVEKPFTSLMQLGEKLSSIVGMAPFLSTFFDDFPVEKSDQRKAVDYFFGVVLGSQLDERSLNTIAEFLSTDIVKKHDAQLMEKRNSKSISTSPKSPTHTTSSMGAHKDCEAPTREGYLTKRGKNFGGWQPRYFVLDGPQLKYFDAPNGVHLGSIKLPQAQIGRQTAKSQTETDDTDEEQMKYAFLILEPKRNDASKMVRHVLCAPSDEDRDEWINALLHYVALDPEPTSAASTHPPSEKSRGKRLQRRQSDATSHSLGSDRPEPDTIGIRYDQLAAGKRPMTATSESLRQSAWPQVSQEEASRGIDRRIARSPESRNELRQPVPVVPLRSPYRAPISAPMNGAPITDETAWSSTQREEERRREEKRAKKRSVWGFLSKDYRGRTTPEAIQPTAPPPPALLQHGLFGIPLRDAVDITREMGMGINVPSVVYRCVEYLEHMDAAKEEGIYRLSGSNSAIRMLKDKFNSEGDVDLVNSRDYHDVHAVAGLLKLYLRELPSTVLTRDRHVEFLHIVDIEDKNARVRRLSELVRGLPKVNYELLRIMSKHLKRIVRHAQENKMTIRNVGIVFSPTLNIPAPVFSLFITEYEVVFDEPDDTPVTETTAHAITTEAPSYTAYNNSHDSPLVSLSNHHLNVQESTSHRRYHSADPPHRGAPPPSFPLQNQGYQESVYRPQVHQQQSYPQQSYQQSYENKPNRPFVNPPKSSYQHSKWDSREESTGLFD